MSTLQSFSAHDLLTLGPRIVGLTFIWAGMIKALEPHIFAGHLFSLGWIPQKVLRQAVSASAALEVGLGTALLLGSAPALVLPVTLVALVVLSGISWWGVKSGRTADCGCYGGYIQPSIGQSLALNGLFSVLVFAGWRASQPGSGVSIWHIVVPAAATLGVAAFAEFAQLRAAKTGRHLVDLNPLKEGRRFRNAWAGGLTTGMTGEVIVAYLGPDCPYCGLFVKVGNAMMESPGLPRVVGVTGASKERLDTFILEKGIRFPVAVISQSTMNRLARAVPTAVLVESGTIKRVWSGNMPPDFVDRFKAAFFPGAPSPQLANSLHTS